MSAPVTATRAPAPARLTRPPRLREGQTIGVVASAGPIRPDRLARGLRFLSDRFALRLAPGLSQPRAPGVPSYLAASDEQRAEELSALLADPDVRAIILARGGYGLTRILPRLDPDLLRRDPKPIVGFSDATALLAWAHAAGVASIHGPMVVQLDALPAADLAQMFALLTSPEAPGPRPWSLTAPGGGVIAGPLVAANLTMASMLVGTPWPLPLAGAILALEDVGEKPYELDRYLTQLTHTGALRDTAAIVVGELTRCHDPSPPAGEPDPPDAAARTVLERAAAAGLPCVLGAPIGHGNRNEAVPFGAACELDLDRGTLAILEAAVA